MTYIQFASCDPHRAYDFIKHFYPHIKREEIPLLMALVEEDILRVQDPLMHSPCSIMPGNKHSAEYSARINEAVNQLKVAIANKPNA